MKTEDDLLDFACRTQGAAQKIMAAALNGHGQRAAELAADLCGQAAAVRRGIEMNREQAAVGTLDLASLPPPRASVEDAVHFECRED